MAGSTADTKRAMRRQLKLARLLLAELVELTQVSYEDLRAARSQPHLSDEHKRERKFNRETLW